MLVYSLNPPPLIICERLGFVVVGVGVVGVLTVASVTVLSVLLGTYLPNNASISD